MPIPTFLFHERLGELGLALLRRCAVRFPSFIASHLSDTVTSAASSRSRLAQPGPLSYRVAPSPPTQLRRREWSGPCWPCVAAPSSSGIQIVGSGGGSVNGPFDPHSSDNVFQATSEDFFERRAPGASARRACGSSSGVRQPDAVCQLE